MKTSKIRDSQNVRLLLLNGKFRLLNILKTSPIINKIWCSLFRYSTVLVLYRLISLVFLEYFNCSMFLNEMNTLNSICWFLCYVPKFATSQLECQFIGVLLLIEERFQILNKELDRLNQAKKTTIIVVGSKIFSHWKNTENRLCFMRNLHWRLCAVSRNLNRIFWVQILLVIGVNFVTFITHAYSTFSGLIKMVILKDHEILVDIVTSLSWGIANLINMFVLCFCCSSVTYAVSFSFILDFIS